jgi:uncharacterized protein (DUF1778 family)
MARINVDLDDELHRKVKATAALKGVTLKDFVLSTLQGAVQDTSPSGNLPPSGQAQGRRG